MELIPNLGVCIKCNHRNADYRLTQALTGHGVFRSYIKRFGKAQTEEFVHCDDTDTTKHLFDCVRWKEIREAAYRSIGEEIGPGALVSVIGFKKHWDICHTKINIIMRAKEEEEHKVQSK